MNEQYSPKPRGRRQPHCSSQVDMIQNLHPHPSLLGEGEIWGEGQVAGYTIYRWLFPVVNFSLTPRAQSLITGALPRASREDRCCCILHARKAMPSPPFTTLCNIKSSWSFILSVSFKSTGLRALLLHFYYCGL